MHFEGDLTSPGAEDRAGHADDIAHIQVGEPRELFLAQDVAVGHQLDSAASVLQVSENKPTLQPLDHQPARHRHRLGSLRVAEQRLGRIGRVGGMKSARIGIDARRAKSLELLAAIAHDSRQIELCLLRHDRKRLAARR